MRVPVPDDYERNIVVVAGRKDTRRGAADVVLDDRDHARNLTVSEDEDGRYVGGSEDVASAVAEYLGVELEDVEDGDSQSQNDDDGTDVTDGLREQIEDGQCPWCDEYEGDGVPQHASSAHPEEWTAYKEAN